MTIQAALGITLATPTTHPHDYPTCGQCPKCHPGRQFGGDEQCHALKAGMRCTCHRRGL